MLNIDQCCFRNINDLPNFDKALMSAILFFGDKMEEITAKGLSNELFGIEKTDICWYDDLSLINYFLDVILLKEKVVKSNKYGYDNNLINDYDSLNEEMINLCNDWFEKYFSKNNLNINDFKIIFASI